MALIQAVDSCPEVRGAGIVLVEEGGRRTEVRGGPRRLWVWIAPKGMASASSVETPGGAPVPAGLWERWGPAALSCGSAAATGAVIWLSGGTVGFVARAFAVNSALLCGTSLGKAMAYDAWQDLERDGGGLYRWWLTTETLLGLIDLFNGTKGALGFLRSWKQAGKLGRLQNALAGRKLNRRGLLDLLRQIDPAEAALIDLKSAKYVNRAKLFGVGEKLLSRAGFVSIGTQRSKILVDAIGNALSLTGAPDNFQATYQTSLLYRKQWDVWIVQFER